MDTDLKLFSSHNLIPISIKHIISIHYHTHTHTHTHTQTADVITYLLPTNVNVTQMLLQCNKNRNQNSVILKFPYRTINIIEGRKPK